ncbi:unnamed protein product [Somion occarium]|uniref:Uncharacterized protein n=1 Tax=Somion occarium TaxID=3059160 RepID=A0ABP1DRA6_9APHY
MTAVGPGLQRGPARSLDGNGGTGGVFNCWYNEEYVEGEGTEYLDESDPLGVPPSLKVVFVGVTTAIGEIGTT